MNRENEDFSDGWHDGFESRDAEIGQLHAEIERLRAALVAAVQEDYRAADGENAWRLAFFRVKGILRRALEPKS